jgi:hypothetical protein
MAVDLTLQMMTHKIKPPKAARAGIITRPQQNGKNDFHLGVHARVVSKPEEPPPGLPQIPKNMAFGGGEAPGG